MIAPTDDRPEPGYVALVRGPPVWAVRRAGNSICPRGAGRRCPINKRVQRTDLKKDVAGVYRVDVILLYVTSLR